MDLEDEKRYWRAYEQWRQAALKTRPIMQRINEAQRGGQLYLITDEDGRLFQEEREAWNNFLEIARQARSQEASDED